MSCLWRSAILVASCAFQLAAGSARADHLKTQVETPVRGMSIDDGKTVTVNAGKHGTVVTFLSARCPCSNAHVELLKRLGEEFKNFAFVAVNSNSDEPLDEARAYFKAAGFSFPVLRDPDGSLADRFKALKTPHAYVVAADGAILYRGGMTASAHGDPASKQYLREALADIEAGRPVKTGEGRTLGCMITRGKK